MDNLTESSRRVVADLRELANLTSDENGAQRVAWSPTWQKARDWFSEKAIEAGATIEIDAAGNSWAKITGESEESVVIGSHIDSVTNGGWLDGALGVVAGLEILRIYDKTKPAKTIYVVTFADEEGVVYGSSVMGSSAATGNFDVNNIINRLSKDGVSAKDLLANYHVDVENINDAKAQLEARKMIAFLELHIEQGPVLEEMNKQVACVYGVQGIERHMIEFTGQPAHAGSFPTLMRKDAFLAAAEATLAFREVALKYDGVCTVGKVSVEPDVPTIFPGKCNISLDQRSINKDLLKAMYEEAQNITNEMAKKHQVEVKWDEIYSIDPTLFDENLVKLCQEAIIEETGEETTMFSGPLHDAVEMARIAPTIMMFVMSKGGLSHNKDEDTPDVAIEIATRAFIRLVDKVVNK